MNKLLADSDVSDIFGKVNPPVSSIPSDPKVAFGNTISFGIQAFILVAAITMLIYLLLGAFDWIVSSGDKERITKAQNKITNAVVGLIIVFAALTIFGLVTGDILNIVVKNDNGWTFNLPTFQSE